MAEELFANILFILQKFRLIDLIDILLLALFIYFLLLLLRGTRARQIFLGVAVILFLFFASSLLGLIAFNWLMRNLITYSFFGLIVIFSEEIKSYLAALGSKLPFTTPMAASKQTVDEVVAAVDILAQKGYGALIVFERNVSLKEYVGKGVPLNSQVTRELLLNLFTPKAPLHDGAVVISRDRVSAASVFLPLPNDLVERYRKGPYGTRHLAALSVSRLSDALVVVVSEETSTISVALDGNLVRNYQPESLYSFLVRQLDVGVK